MLVPMVDERREDRGVASGNRRHAMAMVVLLR